MVVAAPLALSSATVTAVFDAVSRLRYRDYYSTYDRYGLLGPITPGCTSGNCTVDCLSVDSAFSDVQTFANCLMYPYFAGQLAIGNVSQGVEYLQEYGWVNDSTGEIASAVYNTTATCLQDFFIEYAPGDARGALSGGVDSSSYYNGYVSFNGSINSSTVATWKYYNPCAADLPGYSANQDVSGIGVVISYYMQFAIAICIYFYARFCSSWIYWLTWIVTKPLEKTCLRIKRSFIKRVHLTARRHLEAMIPAAVDFHKTQCFFMLSVQIAALLALNRPATLQANYLLEIIVSDFVFTVIPLGGIVPVVFTLALLQIYGRRSWYLFWLTTATYGMGLGVYFRATQDTTYLDYNSADFSSTVQSKPTPIDVFTTSVRSCGKANPGTFCNYQSHTYGSGVAYIPVDFIIPTTAATLGLLFIDLIIGHHARLSSFLQRGLPASIRSRILEEGEEKAAAIVSGWRLSHGLRITALILAYLIYLCLLGLFYFIYFFIIFNLINLLPGQSLSDPTSEQWSFGQIIAIAVWFPVIFEFIYLEVRGVDNILYRLSPHYMVVRVVEQMTARPTNISYFLQAPMMYIIAVIKEGRTPEQKEEIVKEVGVDFLLIRPTRRMTGLMYEGVKQWAARSQSSVEVYNGT